MRYRKQTLFLIAGILIVLGLGLLPDNHRGAIYSAEWQFGESVADGGIGITFSASNNSGNNNNNNNNNNDTRPKDKCGGKGSVTLTIAKGYPRTIDQGESTWLCWDSKAATKCNPKRNKMIGDFDDFDTNKKPRGNDKVSPSVTTKYVISCNNGGGSNTWVTVNQSYTGPCEDGEDNDNDGTADFNGTDDLPPDPGCSSSNDPSESGPPVDFREFSANPNPIRSGETTTIEWNTQRADSCSISENNPAISDSWTGTSGEEETSALETETRYTITCTNNDGDQFSTSTSVRLIPSFEEI